MLQIMMAIIGGTLLVGDFMMYAFGQGTGTGAFGWAVAGFVLLFSASQFEA